MDLITTHENADFDALSSVVAASKLYAGARLLLPGSQEKAVRKFLALIKDTIRVEDEKTCRMDDVTRLIIVDNRHRSRIGLAARLLDKKGMRVHIYDHHPRTRHDIKADKDVFEEVGATVSILIKILERRKKLDLTPMEATLMLLGIYEETGSLSYASTTKLDVDMVSRLLGMGASLNAVSSYLNRELEEAELSVLIDLLESVEIRNINGVAVAFTTADSRHFEGEMGTVVHKLQDVENFPVLFAMFKCGEKVKILGRSRVEMVDMNRLLARFGGAGHASAASARVEGLSPRHLRGEISRILNAEIRPEIYAKDIMRSPVNTVSQESTVKEVMAELERLGQKGAPVLDEDGNAVGMITSGDLKKALKRGMGHSRIKGYMGTPLITVSPETPLYELRRIMMEKGKGRIPVVKDGRMDGMVTRTDVLRKVHSAFFPADGKAGGAVNLSATIKKGLPERLVRTIKEIGAEGDRAGMNVFLVGGFVRDLILGTRNYDLDLVVEGDAISFGRELRHNRGGTLVEHRKFGTATLVKDWPRWLGPSLHPDNKFKIDIATARKEVYERPAALPKVAFASLKEDLYRRDFTVNAMAVNINGPTFGAFVDFFGGRMDLEKGVIRVLHDRSFMDDPTRIFRAVRFEQRFGFVMEKHTEYLIKHAVRQEMFHRTENQRIREELILMLKEDLPEKAILRMSELHELRFIHPALKGKPPIKRIFPELRRCVEWYRSEAAGKRRLDVWLINLMALLEPLTSAQTEDVLKRFVFTRSESMRLMSCKEKVGACLERLSSRKKMTPGDVYALLEPLSHEAVVCLMAKAPGMTARRRLEDFLKLYNGTRLRIKGGDIEKAGIKPGPRYSEILSQVLRRKLDGGLKTKRDEIRYMKELIAGRGDA